MIISLSSEPNVSISVRFIQLVFFSIQDECLWRKMRSMCWWIFQLTREQSRGVYPMLLHGHHYRVSKLKTIKNTGQTLRDQGKIFVTFLHLISVFLLYEMTLNRWKGLEFLLFNIVFIIFIPYLRIQ